MDKIHRAGRANKPPYGRGRSDAGSCNTRKQKYHDGPSVIVQTKYDAEANSDSQGRALCNTVCSFLMALLSDLRDQQPGYGYADFCRDGSTLSRRMAAEGLQFATVRLPVFLDGLLGYLETGKSDFPGFKLGKQHYPLFLRGLVAPIYADSTSSLAVKNLKLVYQFCVAFKKLEGTADEKLLKDQLLDFIQTDIDLNYIDWSQETVRDIARDARKLIGQVLDGLNPFDPEQAEDFRPRPGPGACNSPVKHAHRYRPSVWYDELMSVFNPDEWFKPPYAPPDFVRNQREGCKWWEDHPRTLRIGRRIPKDTKTLLVSDHSPSSRFKFVPKTFTKMRGICIEENEVQWHQQALRRALYKRVESHPVTKGYVNFTSQLVNRELALKGSVSGEWATIDMSSASDRISRKLVCYLFGENKELLKAIEACSTRTVSLPKVRGVKFLEQMPVNKIAPMGSAICFPIMALVHFSLIKAILQHSSIARNNTRDVYVYGDDIIVRRSCVQAIYDYLPLFGMKINTDKSFSHGYFRESCGLHAYKGVEVTPVRFKTLLSPKSSPKDLATALRLEESFYYKGYSQTAGLLRQSILEVARKYRINAVPYVNTKSPVFGFYRADGDAYLMDFVKSHNERWRPPKKSRKKQLRWAAEWSSDLCTWIYHKVVLIVDKFDEKSSFLDEEDRYLRYLVQDGQWASKEYDEGYSRNTMFLKKDVVESALGYRC